MSGSSWFLDKLHALRARPDERQSNLSSTAMSSLGPTVYLVFCVSAVLILKTINEEVTEPYMV